MNEKKNKPDAAALRDAKRGHKARIGYARIVLVCLLGALLAVPACIVQIGLAVQSHDSSQRANGFLAFFGGLLIMFAKEILDFITV